MGHKMKEEEDYEDSFAPVQHATAGCMMISISAAIDLHFHSCDMLQAFVQADKLPEGVNGRGFIQPPVGYPEDDNVVYEVLRPLSGIPSSAQAMRLTLAAWFKEEGFVQAVFKDSVWVREAEGKYDHQLIFGVHVRFFTTGGLGLLAIKV